jgi:hypothetical protein
VTNRARVVVMTPEAMVMNVTFALREALVTTR